MDVEAIDPGIAAAVARRDLAAILVQELVAIDVIIERGEVRSIDTADVLRADWIDATARNINQVVAELAVAVQVTVVKHAVGMAGSTFIDGADGGVPTFLQGEGIGDDREEAMAQLEIRRAQR